LTKENETAEEIEMLLLSRESKGNTAWLIACCPKVLPAEYGEFY
jgi:hypothetical protein